MKKIKYGFYNMFFEIIYYILYILINLITRKVFIKYLGIEIISVNYILNQIVNFISLVEFGICNVIVFNLYSALKEENTKKINSIMNSFRKLYKKVSISIMIIGLCFIPFLKYFINDYSFTFNYIIIYIFILIKMSCIYLFSYKMYLFQADHKSYIYLIIMILVRLISFIIEMIVVITLKNYYIYTIIYCLSELILYYVIYKYADKKYKYLYDEKTDDKEYKSVIGNHIKNTGISKVFTTLNLNIDTFLISLFMKVSMVGMYSNYYLLQSAICYIIQKTYESFKGIFGVHVIDKDINKSYNLFINLHKLIYIISFVCSICFYIFVDKVIILWLGSDYLLSRWISFALSLQLFITSFRVNLWEFVTIKGYFNISKTSDVIGTIMHLILSIVLYYKFSILGIILGNIISQFVQFIIEFIMITKELDRFNIILFFKQIILLMFYLASIIFIKKYFIFVVSLILFILSYFIINIKRSGSYVFKNKKII